MPRPKLSIPHERRKASLKAQVLKDKVRVAELKERISTNAAELSAMKPQKPKESF